MSIQCQDLCTIGTFIAAAIGNVRLAVVVNAAIFEILSFCNLGMPISIMITKQKSSLDKIQFTYYLLWYFINSDGADIGSEKNYSIIIKLFRLFDPKNHQE